jgi:hypothetical protein
MNASTIIELVNATMTSLNTAIVEEVRDAVVATTATTVQGEGELDCGGGTHFPDVDAPGCVPSGLNIEERFLAVLSIALVCAVCALCVLVVLLTALVHKLSTLWVKALVRPTANAEPSDDPRKGLLHETKSCLRDASASGSSGDNEGKKKKKKASFSEDTSCAAPRDADEEEL